MGLWAVVLAVLVLAAVVLGPTAAQAHPSSFADVSTSADAHDAIEYLSKAGVVSGYADGSFKPATLLNRGQATKMLVKQQGLTVASTVVYAFSDVESVYGTYVEAAAAKGWIAGYPDGTFRTYDPLQRQHMAVVVVRCLGWEAQAKSLTPSQIAAGLKGVADVAQITSGARPYVALALSKGLFQGGADGRFSPTAAITRAQFALVAYRAELLGLAVVQGVRVGTDHPDKTRVVLDLSAEPGAISSDSENLGYLNVDVAGSVVEGSGIDKQVGSGEIEKLTVRQLAYRPQKVRVTLDLERFSRWEITSLAPSDGKGYRVVIDIFKRIEGPPGDGPPLVALDPGHGGSDTGAVGVTGVFEKDINLAIALRVDVHLRAAGLRTLLTRSDDSTVSLKQRTDLANGAKAGIFVSIHNNAASSDSHGTETFYWGTADGDYSPEGRRLAEAIQRRLVDTLDSTDRGARTHWLSLHVLRESLMPAALTEVGFLTNAEEEAKLKDPIYQDKAAQAIAAGILEFLGWIPGPAAPQSAPVDASA